MVSLANPPQNPHHVDSPYNSAPTLYRARASDSGSMFHEEGVWPPPNHGTQFVDPFVPARELSGDSDLSDIVDQVMGPASTDTTALPPGAAPAVAPALAGAIASPDTSGHSREISGSSATSSTIPKKSSPLTQTVAHPGTSNSAPQPKNWLERQPKTPSPRNTTFALPSLVIGGNEGTPAPPSAFANSASSLINAYGTPTHPSVPIGLSQSSASTKQTKRVSWGDLPTPTRPASRPGSRQGTNV
ncbi:hypothetical protein GYMLUDRAFT_745571 [Collybiopsis luxurians FD-317 M1]|uniref:Uncharacterized protein n=1 Tax=Collybiopsis luxurians FD-317 M1 TaxID=944289 RepID=A0A0D0CHM1_9AGAR|nr:hypothetical protein GYMLUDRAFT_745571 [Collybiopsis luxurians FD-317 M1]